MNCRSIAEIVQTTSKPGGDVDPGSAWRVPVYWPRGVRHRGSASLVQAFMLNCGNLRSRCKGKGTSSKGEADSTDARPRGGATRSSYEATVMGVALSGHAPASTAQAGGTRAHDKIVRNSQSTRLECVQTSQSKWWKRWCRSTIDRRLRNFPQRQPVQTLESDVLRQLLSAAGQGCADPEEERGHANAGRANGG